MAHRHRSRSPPKQIGPAAEDATEDEDVVEDAADDEFTHLAAVILDQARRRVGASKRSDWFVQMKQDVVDATHVPVTRAHLTIISIRGPRVKLRSGGLWPTTLETISRFVAAYNKAISSTEHGKCDDIVAKIGANARVLRQRAHRPDEFINRIHQWIENRAINVALKQIQIDFNTDCCNAEELVVATEILAAAVDIVRASGDAILASIRTQHDYN